MIPHMIFISAMVANWQAYLHHLRSKLTILVCELHFPYSKTVLNSLGLGREGMFLEDRLPFQR